MISEGDVERVAAAAGGLPAAVGVYVEEDFVTNLLATVVDFQMHTNAVVKALGHFKERRFDEVRTMADLQTVMGRFPDDQEGNTDLAVYLWGYHPIRGHGRILPSTFGRRHLGRRATAEDFGAVSERLTTKARRGQAAAKECLVTISQMELKTIRYEIDGRVATITLNRPHRLNAWTGRMHTEYRWALQQAQDNHDVRVVVVTGEGRGFCAGADASALDGHAARGGYDPGTPDELANPGYGVDETLDHDFAFHFGLRTPVVAAVNGPAAGVGLVLACYADVRFAVAGAKLTTAHGRLNLPAEYGLSWLLPRIVGLGRANDLLLTSRVILAEEAMTIGLVNAVLPDHAALVAHAYEYARSLAHDVSSGSLAATKRQVALDLHRDLGSSVVEAAERLNTMMGEPAFAEGVAALNAKRAPSF